MTDREVEVSALRDGDPDAWNEFVVSLTSRVTRYARRCGHPDPEDVAGAALEAVAKSIQRFDGGSSELWSFVFVVAYARVVDSWRKKDRVVLVERIESLVIEPIDNDASQDAAEDLLDELDGDQRTIMTLRYVEGWSTKDIATFVDKSDVAVRASISRALANIRAVTMSARQRTNPPETGGFVDGIRPPEGGSE